MLHLILCTSPHHSPQLRSHHLSLPRPFTPYLKHISFANPFLHGLSGSFWTAFTDPWNCTRLWGHWHLFVLVSSFLLLAMCVRLSWLHLAFQSTLLFYRIVCTECIEACNCRKHGNNSVRTFTTTGNNVMYAQTTLHNTANDFLYQISISHIIY